jgi:hypothetical protein
MLLERKSLASFTAARISLKQFFLKNKTKEKRKTKHRSLVPHFSDDFNGRPDRQVLDLLDLRRRHLRKLRKRHPTFEKKKKKKTTKPKAKTKQKHTSTKYLKRVSWCCSFNDSSSLGIVHSTAAEGRGKPCPCAGHLLLDMMQRQKTEKHHNTD